MVFWGLVDFWDIKGISLLCLIRGSRLKLRYELEFDFLFRMW